MFEIFEKLENIFDEWYSKGYLLIALVIGVLLALYYLVRIIT